MWIKTFLFKKFHYQLLIVFIIALVLRFLFFPQNIQFAYDQARDAFVSQEVMHGQFKIIGPPSSLGDNINHGALYYYIAGPIYALWKGDPVGLSIFLRFYNTIGVFLIFFIGSYLFNKRTGLIAAFLYSISFEQTQYALFMGHPSMAVLTTMLFYLGFILLIFRKQPIGLLFSAVGFGLSLQFHISLFFLTPLWIIYPLIFKKDLPKIPASYFLISLLAFFVTISTFIIGELKYHFRLTQSLLQLFVNFSETQNLTSKFFNLEYIIHRHINHNLINHPTRLVGVFSLAVLFIIYLKAKSFSKRTLFLLIWFLWGLLTYALTGSQIYYYSIGISISLLILSAVFICGLLKYSRVLGIIILILITISNLQLIFINNTQGPINEITSQDGMLLEEEKKIIDFTYQKANKQPFAVNALTIPYNINTTWSYLYEWYGKKNFGYLPVWGGNPAMGYEGNLIVNTSRSTLPIKRFLIVEPRQGLEGAVGEGFLKEESYFTNTINTQHFGKITLFEQQKK